MSSGEINATILLTLASIPKRLAGSLSTIVSVALAVIVLLAALAMAQGFRATVDGAGSETIAIMARTGATSDLSSVIPREQVRLLDGAPGIAQSTTGQPLLSAEVYVTVDGIKRTTGTKVNLPLRGVGVHGASLRDGFRIVQGRMFVPGDNEIIVGKAATELFRGFEPGKTVSMGSRKWRVVGVFTVPGTVFDSEVWTDAEVAQSLFGRGPSYQTLRARLTSPTALAQLKTWIAAEPRLQLDVHSEKEFAAAQSQQLTAIILWLGWPLAIAIALGAMAGAINAVVSSVEARSNEIVTLRAIGFSRIATFLGVISESIVLCAIGGIIGVLFAVLFFDGLTTSTLGDNFSQIVFSFAVNSSAMLTGVALAISVGLLGGIYPAWRAANAPLSRAGQGAF